MVNSRLLCIPQDGSPFEASGIGTQPSTFDIYNMLGIVNIDGIGINDYDDDILELNTPFQIHPIYKKNNSQWKSISELIDKFYNTLPQLDTIRVYIRKNQHHFSTNKHTIGMGRRPTPPKGIICIWINNQEYLNVSPLPKKKWIFNEIWTYETIINDTKLQSHTCEYSIPTNINSVEQTLLEPCKYNSSTYYPLAWTMANL